MTIIETRQNELDTIILAQVSAAELFDRMILVTA